MLKLILIICIIANLICIIANLICIKVLLTQRKELIKHIKLCEQLKRENNYIPNEGIPAELTPIIGHTEQWNKYRFLNQFNIKEK